MSSVQILSNLNYPIGKVITEGLRNSLNTHIAVAFLKYSGVEVIQDALIDSLEKGAEFEIIVGLDFKTTDSKSIRFLLDLNKTYKKLRFYYYGDKENNKTDIVFHPKIYMFDNGKEKTSIIGNANTLCFNYKHNEFIQPDHLEASVFELKQCIIGDSTDNIKGVAKIGEKKTQALFQPYLDRFKNGDFNGSKALLREALFNEVVLPLYQAQYH